MKSSSFKMILPAGILLVGVVIGVVVDSWQVAASSASIAVFLFALMIRGAVLKASTALREARTELRNLRVFRSRSVERFNSVSDEVSEVAAKIELLRTEIAENREMLRAYTVESGHTHAETMSTIKDMSSSLTASGAELQKRDEKQRLILESMSTSVQTSSYLVGKTKQQLNRTVRRQVEIHAMVELLEGRLTARIDHFLDEAERELRRNRGQIVALGNRIGTFERFPDAGGTASDLTAGTFNFERYLYFLSYHIPREVEAQQQLQRILQPSGFMPLLGGWALTPTGTLDVVNIIAQKHSGIVVECGSGTSTLWFALAAQANGTGHVYALEHDPDFAEATRKRLSEHGLSEVATVVDAPIVEHKSALGPVQWYDLRGLSAVDAIDILVIDGPPQALGNLRGGVVEVLRNRFADQMHLFFDDVNRPAERDLVSNWLGDFPELHTELSSTPVQAHFSWHFLEG